MFWLWDKTFVFLDLTVGKIETWHQPILLFIYLVTWSTNVKKNNLTVVTPSTWSYAQDTCIFRYWKVSLVPSNPWYWKRLAAINLSIPTWCQLLFLTQKSISNKHQKYTLIDRYLSWQKSNPFWKIFWMLTKSCVLIVK